GKWEIISGQGTLSNTAETANPGTVTFTAPDNYKGETVLRLTSNNPDGICEEIYDERIINIQQDVTITTPPDTIGICPTEPSEFTVIASGDNLSYEWKRTDGANITNSNGIYSSTLSFNNTTSTNAGEYYVVVRGEDACNEGELVESVRVTINVDENIIIDEPT